jgi:hypothetical protein
VNEVEGVAREDVDILETFSANIFRSPKKVLIFIKQPSN